MSIDSPNTNQFSIPFSRLIDPDKHTNFIDIIKCKICFNILNNPFDCTKCGNSFCYNCISNLLKNKEKCPFNCEAYDIKPSSFSITSYLSQLKFYCRNKKNGCNEEIKYANLLQHEKECKFFYSFCPNKKCGKKMQWTLIESHIRNECEFSMFQCPTCSLEFIRKDYNEHIKNCLKIKEILGLKKDILNENKEQQTELFFNGLINNIPDLKETNILSLFKIILYQFYLNNQKMNEKLENLKTDISNIRDDIDKVCKNNMIFFQSINNEFENLGNKLNNNNNNPLPEESLYSSIYNNDLNKNLLCTNNSILTEIDNKQNNKKSAKFSSSSDKDEKQENYYKISGSKNNKSDINKHQSKKIKTTQISKNISTVGNRPNYSPKNLHISNGNNNSSQTKKTKEIFQPPSSRPFNTFSSYTNSNLVNIINNQEIIINKLNNLEKEISQNKVDFINEIRNNEITTLSVFASVKDQVIGNQKQKETQKEINIIEKNNYDKDELLVEPGGKDILNKLLDEGF